MVECNSSDSDDVKMTEPIVPKEDPEAAEKLKLWGNEQLKAGDQKKDIELYTEALNFHRTEAILSNRCLAYTQLRKYKEALHDVEQALFIKPDFAKAHIRAFTCYQ